MNRIILWQGVLFFIFCVFPLRVSAAQACSFEGTLDFARKNIRTTFAFENKGLIVTEISYAQEGKYHLTVKADHFQASHFDISTILDGKIEIDPDKNPSGPAYWGTIRSQYSLIDYKPVPDLAGTFEIKEDSLFLRSFQWGGVTVQGAIGLRSPHQLDLAIQVADIKSNEFFRVIGLTEKDFKIDGFINGTINLSGSLRDPQVKGRIESVDGIFMDLEYESILLNFTGAYPLINITDSMISNTNGLIFRIEGELDLSHKDKLSMQAGLNGLQISPLVDESIGRREWTIKRKKEEGTESATELKYRKRNDSLSGPFNNDLDMLGIERKTNF